MKTAYRTDERATLIPDYSIGCVCGCSRCATAAFCAANALLIRRRLNFEKNSGNDLFLFALSSLARVHMLFTLADSIEQVDFTEHRKTMNRRKLIAVIFFVFSLLLPCLSAQTAEGAKQLDQAPGAAVREVKIDPAKEADIRRLLELMDAKTLFKQTLDGMEKSLTPLLVQALPAGPYRPQLIELFFAKMQAKMDVQRLVELSIPVYDKYLSGEEIKGLIQFYSTPVGRKAITVLPKITQEMREEGQKWGGELGRRSMMEVLSEHPDLAKALDDAVKAAGPR